MFSTLLSAALLLLTAGDAIAAPQATGTLLPLPIVCTVPDYPAFKLFARRIDTGVDYPVRLIADGITTTDVTSHMVVSTNSTCVKCGIVPEYWVLKNMKLFPTNGVIGTAGTTVNTGVPAASQSQLGFITSANPPSYPVYCSQATGSATPPVLAVHGSSTLFTMCAFTSVFPPATLFSIVYDRSNIQPVGESCYPVKLIMQSIGIVPV